MRSEDLPPIVSISPDEYGTPRVEFNGDIYKLGGGGYFWRDHRRKGTEPKLSREVWRLVNGDIPFRWAIHHINKCKTDDRYENLDCLPQSKHAQGHMWGNDFHKDVPMPEEAKQKISAFLVGNCNALGLVHSEETRKQISQSVKSNSAGISESNRLRECKPETRQKHADNLARRNKERIWTPEMRAKYGTSRRGKAVSADSLTHSPELHREIATKGWATRKLLYGSSGKKPKGDF